MHLQKRRALAVVQRRPQFVTARDRLAIDLFDHIAGSQAGCRRAAVGRDVGDHQPGCRSHAKLSSAARRQRLDAQSEGAFPLASVGSVNGAGASRLQCAERRLQDLLLAVTQYRHLDVGAGLELRDLVAEDVVVLHAFAVDRGDHVAWLHTSLRCRAAAFDIPYERAAGAVQSERFGECRRDALDRDPELAATHFTLFDQLGHDVARHVGRNREADPDVAARGREDLRVDADQLALGVDQRAARVAPIDRRIDLDEVLEAAITSTASSTTLRADDPHRHGLPDAERIADRENHITDADVVRVAKRKCLQVVALDLQNGKIAGRISADDLGLEAASVRQFDGDFFGLVDDVVVGQDVAVLPNDHT